MAVLTAQKQVFGVVGFIGNFKPSKFKENEEYASVLFESPGLPEGRIWKNLKPGEVALLRKGMRVQLVETNRGGRDTWDVVLEPTPIATIAPVKATAPIALATEPTIDKGTKKEIAAYVSDMGDLYTFCYRTALDKLPEAPEPAKQAMASSLFIATQRRFNLAYSPNKRGDRYPQRSPLYYSDCSMIA